MRTCFRTPLLALLTLNPIFLKIIIVAQFLAVNVCLCWHNFKILRGLLPAFLDKSKSGPLPFQRLLLLLRVVGLTTAIFALGPVLTLASNSFL